MRVAFFLLLLHFTVSLTVQQTLRLILKHLWESGFKNDLVLLHEFIHNDPTEQQLRQIVGKVKGSPYHRPIQYRQTEEQQKVAASSHCRRSSQTTGKYKGLPANKEKQNSLKKKFIVPINVTL